MGTENNNSSNKELEELQTRLQYLSSNLSKEEIDRLHNLSEKQWMEETQTRLRHVGSSSNPSETDRLFNLTDKQFTEEMQERLNKLAEGKIPREINANEIQPIIEDAIKKANKTIAVNFKKAVTANNAGNPTNRYKAQLDKMKRVTSTSTFSNHSSSSSSITAGTKPLSIKTNNPQVENHPKQKQLTLLDKIHNYLQRKLIGILREKTVELLHGKVSAKIIDIIFDKIEYKITNEQPKIRFERKQLDSMPPNFSANKTKTNPKTSEKLPNLTSESLSLEYENENEDENEDGSSYRP